VSSPSRASRHHSAPRAAALVAALVGLLAPLTACGGGSGDGKPSHSAVTAALKKEVAGSAATDTQLGCIADVAIKYTAASDLKAFVAGTKKFSDLNGKPGDKAAAQSDAAACLKK